MTKTFYLIRHGDKIKTVGDPPLSEKGMKQAEATARHMQLYPIEQIIASPILRTQQTAKILADQLKLPVITDALLRERVNWGDDPDQSFNDFIAMWEKGSSDRDWNPPVGDSSRSAGARLQKVIESQSDDKQHIVLITHGGIIADFVLNIFLGKLRDHKVYLVHRQNLQDIKLH